MKLVLILLHLSSQTKREFRSLSDLFQWEWELGTDIGAYLYSMVGLQLFVVVQTEDTLTAFNMNGRLGFEYLKSLMQF